VSRFLRSRTTCACTTANCALAAFSACTATSRSCRVTYSCANNPRALFLLAWAKVQRGLGTGKVGLALLQLRPVQRRIESSNTWPALTLPLKSAYNVFTMPDTWLPTLTSTTGFKVPFAATLCVMAPCSSVAVA